MKIYNRSFVRVIGLQTIHVSQQAEKTGEEAEFHLSNFCMCVQTGLSLLPFLCWHNCAFNSLYAVLHVICRGLEVFSFLLVS